MMLVIVGPSFIHRLGFNNINLLVDEITERSGIQEPRILVYRQHRSGYSP